MSRSGITRREWLIGAGLGLVAPRLAMAQQTDVARQTSRALIIAQSYRATPNRFLANTVRDGALISETLLRLNFDQVAQLQDQDAAGTVEGISGFLDMVRPDDLVIAYFAGHGVEIGNENLLMLNGGEWFVSLQRLMEQLQERSRTVLVFLDACRNNPYDDIFTSGGGVAASRNVGRGNLPVEIETVSLDQVRSAGSTSVGRLQAFSLSGSGIKIVFSTDPYNVALDAATSTAQNSPFAQALSRRLVERRSLDDVIALTTGDVRAATGERQSPWAQGSIGRPLFLAGPPLQRNPSRPRFQVPG